jgi:hypothetical protein
MYFVKWDDIFYFASKKEDVVKWDEIFYFASKKEDIVKWDDILVLLL